MPVPLFGSQQKCRDESANSTVMSFARPARTPRMVCGDPEVLGTVGDQPEWRAAGRKDELARLMLVTCCERVVFLRTGELTQGFLRLILKLWTKDQR